MSPALRATKLSGLRAGDQRGWWAGCWNWAFRTDLLLLLLLFLLAASNQGQWAACTGISLWAPRHHQYLLLLGPSVRAG
eukprot:524972-Pelagomonas_calceolata.AAC.1